MAKKESGFSSHDKNVECLEWLIQISSNPGELIFDGFMGTGSTALAAIETGRHFLGAEISPQYHAVAVQRIQEKTIMLESGKNTNL